MRTGLGLHVPHLAAASFVPSDISGLAAWYDASDAATITASSGSVSQWDDKSGSGYHLAQATGALQPKTGTRTLNSLNVLDFFHSGGDTYLYLAAASMTAMTQPTTIFVVARADAYPAGDSHLLDSWDAGGARNLVGTTNSGTDWALYGGALLAGGTRDTSLHLLEATFNSTSSALVIDGAGVLSGDAGTQSLDGLVVGAGQSGAGRWDGVIAEVVIVDANASAGERASMLAYAQAKWGTP